MVIAPHVGDVAVVASDRSSQFGAAALADGIVAADGQCADIRFEYGEVKDHDAVGTVGGGKGVHRGVDAFRVGYAVDPGKGVTSRLIVNRGSGT